MSNLVNVPVGVAANEHETAPRRNAQVAKAALVRPLGMSCNTVYEMVVECLNLGAGNKAMGWRDVVDIIEEKKTVRKFINGKETPVEKTWMYYEMSPYRYITFHQLLDIMHDVGRGLVAMGLRPGTDDKLHIYASTSHKWMQMYIGSQSQSIPIVTAYDTLGEAGLIHSIKQTQSTAIFTDNALLKTLLNPLKQCDNIKYVIHFDDIDPSDKRQGGKMYKQANDAKQKILEVRPDIKFYSFDEIRRMGKAATDTIDIHPPSRDDLSCIMYTSGSTGDPKGVVLKHYNVVAGVGGAHLGVRKAVGRSDRIICFLPLAHIFELAFELLSFVWGSCIGYATVKTLTNASVRNCNGDLVEFKPTVMVGVAAVWETVRKGILQQVSSLPYISQKVFWGAYKAKLAMKAYHIPGGDALGNLVFKKVKAATGGNLKYLLNGGSPISYSAQEFITNLICPMLLGYGLTETVANTCILDPAHFTLGVAGDLTGGVTVKLVDVEELGYLAKNNQGEVWIKGDCVMTEYYKNPEETKASLTADGWFKTGDIGEWTPRGFLRLIDRKKNLVKTMNGEYIALEKLESIYRSNQYVSNICVYADQTKVKPVAIIFPNIKPLAALAKKMGVLDAKSDDLAVEDVLDNKQLVSAVHAELLKSGRDQGLVGIEMLQGIVFVGEEWTPQNGFVTSAQKLKRKKILDSVQDKVDAVYASSS